MKRIFFISIILMSYLSCSTYQQGRNDCKHQVKKSLRDVAKYISVNKETMVYTINYDKLPGFERARYQRLIDSLQNLTFVPPNDRLIRHTIFGAKLSSLTKVGCEISVMDIRKYFGVETQLGTRGDKITRLFYCFNGVDDNNCYSKDAKYANSGPYSRCNYLIFDIGDNNILTNVRTHYF